MLLENTLRRTTRWATALAGTVLARNAAGLLARRLFFGGALLPILFGAAALVLVRREYLTPAEGLLFFGTTTIVSGFLVALFAADTAATMEAGREQAEEARLLLTARLQRYAIELQDMVNQRTRELRDANATLRATAESNALLALVAQHTLNGVIITDADLRIAWVNAAFTRMTGYELAEIKGRRPAELLLGPGTDAATIERLRHAQRSGQPCVDEVLGYAKAGQPVWAAVDFQPVRDRAGQVVNFVLNLADITADKAHKQELVRNSQELQRLNERLQLAEQRWQLAVEGTNDSVWDWDMASGHVYHDHRWARMLGYEPGELSDSIHGWLGLAHPDDLATNAAALHEHVAERTASYSHELRMRAKNGSWRWILDRGKIVARAADGRPLRMVGMHSDFTARRELEERLRQSEELAQEVSRLALIGGWDIDLGSSRVTWSEGTRRIHEVDDTFVPTLERVWDFFPPEAVPTFRAALGDVTPAQPSFDVEVPLVTAAGRRIWVRILGHGEFADGERVSVHGAIQDITARHETEQAQRELQAQLFQAQKMETLGTLAGGIAHDFNNLLTGILGYHELAAEKLPADHPARECLAEARNASLRARELVEQILTFGRQPNDAQHAAVDVARVAADARRFLRATLPANISIDVTIAPDCGPVRGDATQIHQVILNLASNAAHAMRRQGGALRIAVDPAKITPELALTLGGPAAASYVRLTVSDTGHGMDEATRRRIFDPFFTTKNTREGTGLGLAVVHGIIRAHRGIIDVESAPGRGATFRVYLPTATEAVARPGPVDRAPRGAGEYVCVVDDEEVVGSCTRMVLENHGYRSVIFSSAERCLDRLRDNAALCSVLVTDQTMPGMQGTELAAALRQVRPDLPVVIMSGYFSKISPRLLDDLGRVELLAKPFTTDELAFAVHRALHPAGRAA